MPTLLLHTIGNRDLQFPKDKGLPPEFSRTFLTDNTEKGAEDFLVIRKRGFIEEGQNFRDTCLQIQREYRGGQHMKSFREAVRFPMLEQIVEYIAKQTAYIDKLLLCATLQSPSHPQDTDIVAEIAAEYCREHYGNKVGEVQLQFFNMAPIGKGQTRILGYFHDLMKSIKASGFDQIYISNHQGLPVATRALDFVGFFQGYTYLGVHSVEGVFTINHHEYEHILASLIKGKIIEVIEQADLVGVEELGGVGDVREIGE